MRLTRLARSQTGFTLVELMVVVVIIAILAGIAIPNYNEYLTRAKLAEATSALSEMRVKMERHFQDNRSYVGACVAGTQAPLPTATANFTFSCPAADLTANTYRVLATGTGSMLNFNFSINQDNLRKTESVPAGSGWNTPNPNTCWVRNKSGGC